MFFENRLSCGYVTLFSTCHAISMDIRIVLPEPVAILQQSRVERPAVAGNLDSHSFGSRGFRQPDQRFDGFQLAEEEAAVRVALLRVAPMLQQALGDAGRAGIIGIAPGLDSRSDLVDQRQFDEDAGIVE